MIITITSSPKLRKFYEVVYLRRFLSLSEKLSILEIRHSPHLKHKAITNIIFSSSLWYLPLKALYPTCTISKSISDQSLIHFVSEIIILLFYQLGTSNFVWRVLLAIQTFQHARLSRESITLSLYTKAGSEILLGCEKNVCHHKRLSSRRDY